MTFIYVPVKQGLHQRVSFCANLQWFGPGWMPSGHSCRGHLHPGSHLYPLVFPSTFINSQHPKIRFQVFRTHEPG